MTDQERQQGFLKAVRQAEQQFGLTIIAVLQEERLGEALLVRPMLQVVKLEGWKEPEPIEPKVVLRKLATPSESRETSPPDSREALALPPERGEEA